MKKKPSQSKQTSSPKSDDSRKQTTQPTKDYSISFKDVNLSESIDLLIAPKSKSKKTKPSTLSDYKSIIHKYLSDYNPSLNELDNRFGSHQHSEKTLMKQLGMIKEDFYLPTTLLGNDKREPDLTDSTLRITTGKKSEKFRASTCLIASKWKFEVILLSGQAFSVGITQILTEENDYQYKERYYDFETHSASINTKVIKPNDTLLSIEIGDVITVFIDIDQGQIIYMKQNLSPYQTIFDLELPHGPNYGYFPFVKLKEHSSAIVNFGAFRLIESPFELYHSIDIPQAIFTKSNDATIGLLEIMANSGLTYLTSSKLSPFVKSSLLGDMMNFLANVSFQDPYILRSNLIPFILDIAEKEECVSFIKAIQQYSTNPEELTSLLIENIAYEIEYLSLTKQFDEWENLIDCFIVLLKEIDYINSKDLACYLNLIFSFYNYPSMNKIWGEIDMDLGTANFNEDDMISKLSKVKEEYEKKSKDLISNNALEKMIWLQIWAFKKKPSVHEAFDSYVLSAFDHFDSEVLFDNFLLGYYFTLIKVYNEKYTLENEAFISINPWLIKGKKLDINSRIGGTMQHVFSTYDSSLKSHKGKNKKSKKIQENLFELIDQSYVCLSLMTKRFRRNCKITPITIYTINEKKNIIRKVFYHNIVLFSTYHMNLLKDFAMHMTDYFLKFYNDSSMKELTYFLSMEIIIIPRIIAEILKSEMCPIKDYILTCDNIVKLFGLILTDKNITLPKMIDYIFEFVSKWFNDDELYKSCIRQDNLFKIFKGLHLRFNSTNNDEYDLINFLIDLYKFKNEHSNEINQEIKTMFNTHQLLFECIIEAFYQEFNKYLTSYLGYTPQQIMTQGLNHMINDFLGFINYTIYCFPQYYFMKNNIANLLLRTLLSNISTRLIEEKKIIQIIAYNPIGLQTARTVDYYSGILMEIDYSLFDIIKGIYSNNKHELYNTFMKDLLSNIAFKLDNYYLFTQLAMMHYKQRHNDLDKISKIINEWIEKRNKLNIKTEFTSKDWEEIDANDNICILCYTEDISMHFNPCNHGCCLGCMKQYLFTNTKCFLCNGLIESIKEDSSIVINHSK